MEYTVYTVVTDRGEGTLIATFRVKPGMSEEEAREKAVGPVRDLKLPYAVFRGRLELDDQPVFIGAMSEEEVI